MQGCASYAACSGVALCTILYDYCQVSAGQPPTVARATQSVVYYSNGVRSATGPPVSFQLCANLHRVNTRRADLGRKIARARRAAGYRSQRAFADACGIGEKSVADVERGSDRPGIATYDAIARVLGWPEGAIGRYLDTGDPADLDRLRADEPTVDDADDRERRLAELERLAVELERQAQHLRRELAELGRDDQRRRAQ